MDFITIDFETATAQRNTPCEIGLTFVENFKIIETRSWLIKPKDNEFDLFNIGIHGIEPDHVADEPEFYELWPEIEPLIEGEFLIAHNAGFDFSVLRHTLDYYNITFPELTYACSYIFSKKVWAGLPSYSLDSVCAINDIDLDHHRAGPDSLATAHLAIKAFETLGVKFIEDFPEKLKTNIGKLFGGGYEACTTKRKKSSYKYRPPVKIVGDPEKHNPESIFYGKSVVFTGKLSSMVRREAKQKIADIGGILRKSMSSKTDFLIIGQQDYRKVGEDGMSNKQKKAIELINNDSDLEILSEDDFLKNL